MISLAAALIAASVAAPVQAAKRGPIIDAHTHAYPAGEAIPAIANPREWHVARVEDGFAHLQTCLAKMKRLNIVKGVVSGAAPGRIVAGVGVRSSADTLLPELGVLRKAFSEGRLRALGEVTAEYAGLALSDAQYEPYLALAEELDIPVAVHSGTGPPGISLDECRRSFRVSLGNTALEQEALNLHPKLRVSLVPADAPRAEFLAYLRALVRAGLGKQLMFGSDRIFWPQRVGLAVEGIESATFPTPAQKRDIFYGNAVRFSDWIQRAEAPSLR